MSATQIYINGVFIQQMEGVYGPFLSIGITEEGLEALKALPPNQKGIRNLTANPKKANPNKYSCKPYVPQPRPEDLAKSAGKTLVQPSNVDPGLPF